MTERQESALRALCARFSIEFDASNFYPRFDLPAGWVAGQVGPIYVGCSPEGNVSS
jgi:hypothetical protein